MKSEPNGTRVALPAEGKATRNLGETIESQGGRVAAKKGPTVSAEEIRRLYDAVGKALGSSKRVTLDEAISYHTLCARHEDLVEMKGGVEDELVSRVELRIFERKAGMKLHELIELSEQRIEIAITERPELLQKVTELRRLIKVIKPFEAALAGLGTTSNTLAQTSVLTEAVSAAAGENILVEPIDRKIEQIRVGEASYTLNPLYREVPELALFFAQLLEGFAVRRETFAAGAETIRPEAEELGFIVPEERCEEKRGEVGAYPLHKLVGRSVDMIALPVHKEWVLIGRGAGEDMYVIPAVSSADLAQRLLYARGEFRPMMLEMFPVEGGDLDTQNVRNHWVRERVIEYHWRLECRQMEEEARVGAMLERVSVLFADASILDFGWLRSEKGFYPFLLPDFRPHGSRESVPVAGVIESNGDGKLRVPPERTFALDERSKGYFGNAQQWRDFEEISRNPWWRTLIANNRYLIWEAEQRGARNVTLDQGACEALLRAEDGTYTFTPGLVGNSWIKRSHLGIVEVQDRMLTVRGVAEGAQQGYPKEAVRLEDVKGKLQYVLHMLATGWGIESALFSEPDGRAALEAVDAEEAAAAATEKGDKEVIA